MDTQGSRPSESSILKGLSKASFAQPAEILNIDVGGDLIAPIEGEWRSCHARRDGGGGDDSAGSSWGRLIRQSLQDWSRVGAVTPRIHLRWIPGAEVEFPYRERTLEVVLEVVGTV